MAIGRFSSSRAGHRRSGRGSTNFCNSNHSDQVGIIPIFNQMVKKYVSWRMLVRVAGGATNAAGSFDDGDSASNHTGDGNSGKLSSNYCDRFW